MEKLVYLTWASPTARMDDQRDRLIDACADALLARGARGLSMNVRDSDANVASPSPGMTGRPPIDAQISLWLDSHFERAPYDAIIDKFVERKVSYLVTESLYTEYGENRHAKRREWADGERSPGVTAVTLLEKPAHFEYERWIKHWYGTQSPVSEAMQPRARYVRNAVVHALEAAAPPYLGIVEEAWPSPKHLQDPYLFYGALSFPELATNMRDMLVSVTGFLALPRIQTVMMSEYLFKSPALEEE